MLALFQRFKKAIFGTLAGLMAIILVYTVGRRNRNGELNLQIANHELKSTLDKQSIIQQDLAQLQEKKVRLVSDILAEQIAKDAREAANAKKSDQDIVDLLRKRGDIK